LLLALSLEVSLCAVVPGAIDGDRMALIEDIAQRRAAPEVLHLASDNFHSGKILPTNFLTLPSEIRGLIYNAILPLGPLIILRVHAHTTLLKHIYALAQTCKVLQSEIGDYLAAHPLTILCTRTLKPSILNGVPTPILNRVETLIIEDSPAEQPDWRLLRNVSSICFTEIYDLNIEPTEPTNSASTSATATSAQIQLPSRPALSPIGTSDDPTSDRATTMLPTYPPYPASLPTTNTVLSHAHKYWQSLRLEHGWIRALWKRESPYDEMGQIIVLLRRVFEARVAGESLEGKVVAWHGVVDVDGRKVLENRYLGVRTEPGGAGQRGKAQGIGRAIGNWEEEDGYVFPYAAQRWWRREIVVKEQ
jgi:hypothetical protein